jgi:hypothetical protein
MSEHKRSATRRTFIFGLVVIALTFGVVVGLVHLRSTPAPHPFPSLDAGGYTCVKRGTQGIQDAGTGRFVTVAYCVRWADTPCLRWVPRIPATMEPGDPSVLVTDCARWEDGR